MKAGIKTLGFACVVSLVISGCKTDNIIEASYLMPANSVKDVKALNPLTINVETQISGNTANALQNEVVRNDLRQRIISSINSEGTYRTVDAIWGDKNGPRELQKYMRSRNNPHGYDLYHTPTIKAARMDVKLTAEILFNKETRQNKIQLKRTNYFTKYKDGVPYAERGKTKVVKELAVPTVEYKAVCSGEMDVKIYDNKNKLVYSKSFKDLKADSTAGVYRKGETDLGIVKISGNFSVDSQLPHSALIGKMIAPAVEELVKDISPHRVTSKIAINDSGEAKSVTLLKAQAFIEAVERLDALLATPNQRTVANYQNMAIVLEILGDFFMARSYWEKALELKPGDERLLAGLSRARKIIEGQGKL